MDRERIAAEIRAEIASLQAALTALDGVNGHKTTKSASPKVAPRKRRMSAAGRKAIREAVKRRWAKVKAAKKA